MRDELKCLLHGRCDVEIVGEGDAALASIRDDAPDLVLAGVSMPFLDGLGLLRAIRADPTTSSIPVILLEARDGEADRAEAFECGADDYLAKPFGVRELSARVAAHVELARLRKEVAGRTTAVEPSRHGAELSRAILSSLRDHVAVLDEDGVIIAVNEAWARSTGDRGLVGTSCVGDNYLEVCRRAAADPHDSASRALAGIGAVLTGAMPYFELEYTCVFPAERRWFVMTVTPLKEPEGGVVVVHRDITDRRRLREAIEERLGFETLVTDLTVKFVNLPLDRIDEAIEQALARIAHHLEVDQLLLGEFTAEGTAPRVTHAYSGPGILPGPQGFLFGESSPYVTLLRGGEPVVFSRLPDDLPRDEARERADWPVQGLKSLLAIPLIVGGTVVGLLAIASCRPDRSWPEALTRRLRLLGGIFAAALQRQRAEEALREIEGRLARAEDSALVMTTHVGLDGRWLKVPPTLCLLLGYTEEELLASSFKDVTHPDDFEADWSQHQRLIRGEVRSFDLEKRYIRKDGRIIWVYLNCSIVTDAGGQPVHFLAYLRDITERKRAEEALRESEERFRGTFENAAVGIAHADGEGRFLRVNEKLCDFVGYTRAELLARTFRDITYPEDLAASLERFNQLMRGELPSVSLEKRYLRKDGSLVWGHVSVSIQRDAAGKPAYAIAILQDISERKRAEEALRLANARLDLAVRGSKIGIWENDMPDGVAQNG
ncbi:MAG: PAS domain S-box protein, partial [Planctomycetaceae bacterium]|nr:PAS domain S-box protein [Planctomycetaceae bacterium]